MTYSSQPSTHSHKKNENSYISQMTQSEKVLAGFAIFFLIVGAFPVTILFLFYIIYSVSERDKLKVQISHIIIQRPITSVDEIASQVGVDIKKAREILKAMILTDGEPIQFNLGSGQIKKMGKLSIEPFIYTKKESKTSEEQGSDYQNVEEAQGSNIIKERETTDTFSCFQCSAELPEIARYCNDCGVRQSR